MPSPAPDSRCNRTNESTVSAFFTPTGYVAYMDAELNTLLCPQSAAAATCAVTRGDASLGDLANTIKVQDTDHPNARFFVIVYLKPQASGSNGNRGNTGSSGGTQQTLTTPPSSNGGPRKRQRLTWYKHIPDAVKLYIPRNAKGYFLLITEAGTGQSSTGYSDGDSEKLTPEQCIMLKKAYNITVRYIMQQFLDAAKETDVRAKVTRVVSDINCGHRGDNKAKEAWAADRAAWVAGVDGRTDSGAVIPFAALKAAFAAATPPPSWDQVEKEATLLEARLAAVKAIAAAPSMMTPGPRAPRAGGAAFALVHTPVPPQEEEPPASSDEHEGADDDGQQAPAVRRRRRLPAAATGAAARAPIQRQQRRQRAPA